jgi:PIN domain nuclease of toxin-antitoxin system
MRYLIDTNIVVFSMIEKDRLSRYVSDILNDCENRIYVSSESVKEVFMLLERYRIDVPAWKRPQNFFNTVENEWGFTIKYVQKEHLLTFATLEAVKDHNDPFDHMIIAQAITEKMPLISSDAKMQHYREQKLDFIFNEK